jgi:Ca2+:H+ antiporter
MGRPYSLALDPFSALVLFLSVTHAYATSADGASNWLLGVQLIGTYVLIALPFLYMRD